MYTKKKTAKSKLIGLLKDGSVANNRQAKDVVCFATEDRAYSFTYVRSKSGKPEFIQVSGPGVDDPFNRLQKSKGKYYEGEIGGEEVRVSLGRLRGELRYMINVPMSDAVVEHLMKQGYYSDYY